MIKVTYIDHMGEDLTVVNAARVSFGKKRDVFQEQEDYRLIRYLAEHGHTSPFGHCFVSFHVKAPVFVARQLVKHKFLRWNEISRRYVDDLPSYYTPKFRHAAKNKKQGSGSEMAVSHQQDAVLEQSYIKAHESYKYLIKTGVCPEQARIVLPQGFMTEWYWSGSLDAFADMCNLRCASDTQYETRLVARGIGDEMRTLFPVSWDALVKVNGHQAEKINNFKATPKDMCSSEPDWYNGDGGEIFE